MKKKSLFIVRAKNAFVMMRYKLQYIIRLAISTQPFPLPQAELPISSLSNILGEVWNFPCCKWHRWTSENSVQSSDKITNSPVASKV